MNATWHLCKSACQNTKEISSDTKVLLTHFSCMQLIQSPDNVVLYLFICSLEVHWEIIMKNWDSRLVIKDIYRIKNCIEKQRSNIWERFYGLFCCTLTCFFLETVQLHVDQHVADDGENTSFICWKRFQVVYIFSEIQIAK